MKKLKRKQEGAQQVSIQFESEGETQAKKRAFDIDLNHTCFTVDVARIHETDISRKKQAPNRRTTVCFHKRHSDNSSSLRILAIR